MLEDIHGRRKDKEVKLKERERKVSPANKKNSCIYLIYVCACADVCRNACVHNMKDSTPKSQFACFASFKVTRKTTTHAEIFRYVL